MKERLKVIHRDLIKGIDLLCEAHPRKDPKSIFPKWWCEKCKRYVLPDGKKHYSIILVHGIPEIENE